MSSKNDDTLSLPGLSQELSFDVTADEDFIPPSQPQSAESSKISKNSDMCIKKLKLKSDSNIAETPPFKAVIDQSTLDWDESADFIPETETKKTKTSYVIEDFSCKKKLTVFNSEEILKVQSNPAWSADVSRVPESPALETLSFSTPNDSPTKAPSNQEVAKKFEESVTEIIVNDSAETVDLESIPVKVEKSESGKLEEKLEISCSLNYDAERCEETQVFDNSSVVLIGQPGTASLDLEKSEIGGVTEELYLQQTIDDNEANSQKEVESFDLKLDPPAVVAEMTKKSDTEKDSVDVLKPNENSVPKKEIQLNSLYAEQANASIVTRKIDFKLTVNCYVTFNTKTNRVIQKIISNVNEIPKSKPKPTYFENASDNASDKSKRYSTSSSGSVYSDKMALPFALPKRISTISDLTDSSEDEFGLLFKEERRALGRIPWSNEYLLPLKMDDIMQVSIEKEELLKRPMISSPRKPKSRHCDGANHLKEILESSSSEQTSLCNLDTREPIKAMCPEDVPGKETPENSETLLVEKTKKVNNLEEKIQSETDTNNEVSRSEHYRGRKEENTTCEPISQKFGTESEAKQLDFAQEIKGVEGQTILEGENTSITFCDGLPVFARWTDKLYYSGILCGSVKNDRWDVKFDDGTSKAVREDFLMPVEWLKSGALVFVLVDDKYESGQILNVKKGEEVNYTVGLDITKKKVSVGVADLCLTDVMAGIVREKYKPLAGSPRGKAEIDFENVLSGKRLREQRTPLKPFTVQIKNSETKKKSSSKTKKAEEKSLEPFKEISSNTNPGLTGGLNSENGHLLEDKVISGDSASGNEMVETPLRGKPKEPRGKAKPRSLSYTFEETRLKKNWLAPDGTPIPGPSGIKFKKPKTNAKIIKPETSEVMKGTESPTRVTRSCKKSRSRSKGLQPTEKSRRKRKLNECDDNDIQKKSLKEEGIKVNRKVKKG